MVLAEPTTTITDWILGALAVGLATRLLAAGRREGRTAVFLWGVGLVALGVGALAGGTWHGLGPSLGDGAKTALWKLTVYAIGLVSLFLLYAAFTASIAPRVRRWLVGLAAAKFLLYAAWMIGHDDFLWVVVDYVPSMIAIGALQIRAWRRGEPSGRWIVAGLAVSFLAAGIQRAGPDLHAHFDRNGLYHVVQMAGVWLLYRGGMRLRDVEGRGVPSTHRRDP